MLRRWPFGLAAPGLAAPGPAARGLAARGLAARGPAARGLATPVLAARGRAERGWALRGRAALGPMALGLALLGLMAAGAAAETGATATAADVLARQRAEYDAVQAKTVLQLQPFRHAASATLASGAALRLLSLAPGANSWFLLTIGTPDGKGQTTYHLENADPAGQSVTLGAGPALVLAAPAGTATCAPWVGDPAPLTAARESGLPYAPLCDGRLYLRNPAGGARSLRENVTDFLRDNVWGGEEVVQFVKNKFYRDAFAEADTAAPGAGAGAGAAGPAPALLDPDYAARPGIATDIGLGLVGTEAGRMALGAWYPVDGAPGVFASAIQPRALSAEVLKGPGKANRLDAVEAGATDYFVAFDLGLFDLGFALGTDHPRLDWSPRPPASMRPRGLPGPDGVATSAPLVRLGMVSPALAGAAVATFAGGFKRHHGAFKWGPFATVNAGSHYGFVEQGVIFSKLQPDLSTLYVLDDGTIGMKTWQAADDALLPRLRFARQNGVALIAPDPETGRGMPGDYVTQWGAGNWSGSAEAELRTLRAGACLLDRGDRRFLVYGYFSTATPSAMARVFQGYGCHYAMLLDMNAPELTYLAVYARIGGQLHVEHLIPMMADYDKKGAKGTVQPRFLAFPDSRDVFYLTRRR